MKKILFAAMALLVSVSASAQFQRTPTPNDNLVSVETAKDGSVTFRIYAPNAKQVSLSGDIGARGLTFTKADDGVWSATLPNVTAGAYRYTFVVDGITVFDPKYKRLGEIRPVVEIGAENAFWAQKDVPHGAVSQVYYKSSTMGTTRRMHIWTPAGYNASSDKLPVLYLIHGGGDNDASWPGVGKAGDILDNLLAEGKMVPMVVVMPDGSISTDKFPDELTKDIIPYIEKNYRVKTDSANRALAGLSMGGLETLDSFMAHPDMFGYINVMSSGWFRSSEADFQKKTEHLKNIAGKLNKTAKVLRFTMGGKEDFAYPNCQRTMECFKNAGIEFDYSETPGGHSWHVWHYDLRDFAPMLF